MFSVKSVISKFVNYLWLFLILASSVSYANNQHHKHHKEIKVGFSSVIQSDALNQLRQIEIYLPDNYHNSNKHYPVIYVVDSQRYFLHAIAYQQTLLFANKVPEFIVVGIKTDERARRDYLATQANKFVSFFQNELIPHIDKNYRTNKMNMYFGWEMAGGFALDLMVNDSKLFNAYFLASSTFFEQNRLDAVKQHLSANKSDKHLHLYFSLGEVESWSLDSHQALSDILTESSLPEQNWQYDLSASDDHYSTPFQAFNKGLNKFFADFAPLRFYTIEEFNKFGGMTALQQHYKNRGLRFGINQAIHNDTKHYLLNQALKENNYTLFTKFEAQFDGLISHYYDRAFWYLRYSNFHAQHNNSKAAKAVLQMGLAKFPDSAEIKGAINKL